jgi:hypothetical protein
LVEIVRRIVVVKKLYGVVALAAGAFVLGPVYAQSPLDDWNACVDTWGEEACGPAPSEDPPSDPTTPTDPDPTTPTDPDPTTPTDPDPTTPTNPDPTTPTNPDPTPPLPEPTPPLPDPTPPTTQPPASPPVVGTPGGPSGHGKRHAFGHWRNHGHQYAYGHAKACPKVTNFGRSVQAAVAALVKKAKSR